MAGIAVKPSGPNIFMLAESPCVSGQARLGFAKLQADFSCLILLGLSGGAVINRAGAW